jgi:hypothetical protein
VGAHHLVRDLLGLQEADQVGPGHVQRVGRLLGRQHGVLRHDLHALPVCQEAENLGKQDSSGPRNDQRIIIAYLNDHLDRLVLRMDLASDISHFTGVKLPISSLERIN